MTSSGGTLSQLEALFVQLPENDSFESNPPGTYVEYLFCHRPLDLSVADHDPF